RLHLARVDPQLLDLDRLAPALLGRADAAPRRRLHARDQLPHREGLHEVVVGTDLERVHPVVLGAARRHDDDRGPDSLGARRLDQLPAVELGEHQVEHADVGVLEPEPRESEVAAADDDGVEPGGDEVAGHAVGDHVVVLDDQDPRHVSTILGPEVPSGCRNGVDPVNAASRPGHGRDDGGTMPEETYDRSFDRLRTGFTAAVSHELRTPLARILVLLDSADLPGADVHALIDQARAEVENAGALIDEILFLSELESGKEVVALGRTAALPVLEEVVRDEEPAAARAGVTVTVEG